MSLPQRERPHAGSMHTNGIGDGVEMSFNQWKQSCLFDSMPSCIAVAWIEFQFGSVSLGED
jgi:hypothetical protein